MIDDTRSDVVVAATGRTDKFLTNQSTSCQVREVESTETAQSVMLVAVLRKNDFVGRVELVLVKCVTDSDLDHLTILE